MQMRRHPVRLWLVGSALMGGAATTAVAQQNYPTRAIRLIVPSAPGGGTDITARIMAPKLSEYMGHQVVVENRAGAATMIGGEAVVRSIPDGHTLLMGISTLAINPAMYRKVAYDALKDLATISQVVTLSNVLVTHPSLPAKSMKELVALAKTRPNQINFASAGVGTNQWFGILAPSGTPRAIVDRLHCETVRALKEPEVRDRLVADGSDPVGSSPE